MIEGFWAGSGSLTNGSGSRRPKNIWILRIRIRNTAEHWLLDTGMIGIWNESIPRHDEKGLFYLWRCYERSPFWSNWGKQIILILWGKLNWTHLQGRIFTGTILWFFSWLDTGKSWSLLKMIQNHWKFPYFWGGWQNQFIFRWESGSEFQGSGTWP